MKLGVITAVFYNSYPKFENMLDKVKNLGLEAVEIGAGNYPGSIYCNAQELLESNEKLKLYKEEVEKRDLLISALAVHGNPLHPDESIAREHNEKINNAILLAEKLGVSTITLLSGCPGSSENDKYPNWVTCSWPNDYPKILDWQWEKKVIPYWKKMGKFAKDYGVRLAFEMHPGFVVYNTETLLKLRENVGDVIGANFDPSHLFWQGIDPIVSMKKISETGALFHIHVKDTKIDNYNTALNGVLDTKSFIDIKNRSWLFRVVGYGNGYDWWKNFISQLSKENYDYVLSIEHEDALMSGEEGMKKTIEFLKEVVIKEKPAEIYWA
ncbi:MAG: sugar phosphate isomerase/epimerase [Actinomycetota bacterium]